MEKSRKIGIITLCLITCIIGVVYVSAKLDTSRSPLNPETLYVERILDYPEGSIKEIINLEGYKDLQISWVFDVEGDAVDPEGGGVLSVYWCSEEEYQVDEGEVWKTYSNCPDGNWETKSTKVQSNYLIIQTVNNLAHEDDRLRIILYATK